MSYFDPIKLCSSISCADSILLLLVLGSWLLWQRYILSWMSTKCPQSSVIQQIYKTFQHHINHGICAHRCHILQCFSKGFIICMNIPTIYVGNMPPVYLVGLQTLEPNSRRFTTYLLSLYSFFSRSMVPFIFYLPIVAGNDTRLRVGIKLQLICCSFQ